MQRINKIGALIIFTALLALVTVNMAAEEVAISNSQMTVVLDSSNDHLTLKSKVLKQSSARLTLPIEIVSARKSSVSDPVWGEGAEIAITHHEGSQTFLQLFDDSPFLFAKTVLHNPGHEVYATQSLEMFDLEVELGNQSLMSYGTGGLKKPGDTEGSYTFHALVNGDSRNGLVTGCLTHHRGVGIFHPGENGELKTRIEFGHFQIDAEKSRDTEIVAIGFFADARLGLEEYAASVAKQEKIQMTPMPNVYCTWYHKFASDEETLRANTEFAEAKLKPFGLNVMQIDDRWQSILPKGFQHEGEIPTTGPVKVFVDTDTNYSKGMAHTANMIESHGMIPGIWFMPFAGNYQNPYFDHDVFAKNADGTPYHDARWSGTCVDATSPKGEQFIYQRTKRIAGWGYRYFKIDGLHTGMPSKNIYINTDYKDQNYGDSQLFDPGLTHIQAYRKGLETVREAAPGVFVLGCNVSQNMMCMGPAFGLMEAMRIGPDNGNAGKGDWNQVTLGAWHGTNLYFLNGRIWHNDPDPIYVRDENPIESARWMCSWLAVAGGMHSSSEQYSELSGERLDILRRCLPSHDLPARPVDLLETYQPRIWLARNDRINLVGLFNWEEGAVTEIDYDMGKMGLDPSATYIGFDFWQNQFVEPFSVALKQSLPAGTCRVLALKRQKDHPQLVSTSRHITQGLIDVVEENWDATKQQLSGKSDIVGNDPYELRIALPAKGTWAAPKITVDHGQAELVEQTDSSLRIRIDSPKSARVAWTLAF